MRLLILALGFCLISGCANTMDGSAVDTYTYWSKISDIFSLVETLKNDGFKYGNDLDDIAYLTDVPVPPEVLQGRKYGNCHDYVEYYAAFLDSKQKPYEVWLLRKGLAWHYILFTEGYCLSNLEISSKDLNYWYSAGWEYQKKVR